MDPLDQTNRLFSGSSGLTARSPILLQVNNLTTVFDLNGRVGIVVDGVSFAIGKGETSDWSVNRAAADVAGAAGPPAEQPVPQAAREVQVSGPAMAPDTAVVAATLAG